MLSYPLAGWRDGRRRVSAQYQRGAVGDSDVRKGSLPDYLIIGAQRCGTSTLYSLLTEHPQINKAGRKEVHYFDQHFSEGLSWYRSWFPAEEAGKITGESSPYCLLHPLAPERVARIVPDIQLIVLLRNPVERAFSQYHQQCRRGYETLETFEEAIEAEPKRLAGERERIIADPHHDNFAHRHYSYLARGRYAEQLEHWFANFDRQRIHIIRSEDLYERPRRIYRRTLAFLGLDFPSDLRKARRQRNAGNYETQMDASTRAMLEEYFEPHNQRLYQLLDRDFGW